MALFRQRHKPGLTVVAVFYNMRREAERTLISLTTAYQRNIAQHEYEVIVVDSGSTEPLNKHWVLGIQENFSYYYVDSPWPTPCRAMNVGAEKARGNTVVNLIDGARILSPGILSNIVKAEKLFARPFVYTLGMHLGHQRQNEALLDGYNQQVENELLASVNWQEDGYRLFNIACLAGSSKYGYLNPIYESNCFSINKETLKKVGGFDESFQTPGGGLVNLDVFGTLINLAEVQPVLLAGEATFHQFHGGVATNVPKDAHPWKEYEAEYQRIRGVEFKFGQNERRPFLMGEARVESLPFWLPPLDNQVP